MRPTAGWRGLAVAVMAILLGGGCAARDPAPTMVGHVTGLSGAEDLVVLPGTKWLIAGGLAGLNRPGSISFVDRGARRGVRAEPFATALDAAAFPDCPGPPNPAGQSMHGLGLRPHRDGATLYAVNQGRSAIEVFQVVVGDDQPRLTWIGCVPLPARSIGNGVTSLPGGAIAATFMVAPEYAPAPAPGSPPAIPMALMSAGETTGYAAVWRAGQGWRKVPGSEGSGPNGIEASADGHWLWVALWGSRQVIRVPTEGPGEKTVLELDLWPDNLRWGEDGGLWTAGAADVTAYMACRQQPACRAEYAIARIDPRLFKVENVTAPAATPTFGDATTALLAANELWLAAYPSDRIAVLKPKR
jgi:hypothetical protein